MDPNATAAALLNARQALTDAQKDRVPASELREIRGEITEHVANLRDWRARGGFTPRDGWPAGV